MTGRKTEGLDRQICAIVNIQRPSSDLGLQLLATFQNCLVIFALLEI